MLGALDTVRKFGTDEKIRQRAVSLLERGLASIGDVVGATLATYRMPLSQRRLEPQDFEDLRILAELEARRRELALAWSCRIDRPIALPATELRQITLNLLLNACAATPSGGTVGFSAVYEENALGLVVEDEGPGMPDSVAGALMRDDDGREPAPQGIGIPVVRALLRELGGRISVRPRQPCGTRVELSIPAGAAAPADAAE
jgi:signal transduction histidine kinase